MFEYFGDNYTWDKMINGALGMGASIGDIDDASRPLREVSGRRDQVAAVALFEAWTALGERLCRLAGADEAKGRNYSASDKYRRASIFFLHAERMQAHGYAPRKAAYERFLDCFGKYIALGGVNCRRVEVPYKDTSLPALFVSGLAAGQEKAPCMVHFDGLDSAKEMIFMQGIPDALARRGVSTLVVDNPGVGESLRLRGLTNFPEAEVPAKAAVDYLESIAEVDAERIGMMANSLGGYHAPRAAAFEKRFKCCVAWGVIYDWGETQRGRYENSHSSLPVPHYWEHVGWVFGKSSVEEILEVSAKITLRGVLQHVECPILFVHGENDRQISIKQAEQCIAECTASPKAELYVHTLADGGAEHCGVDNLPLTREVMTDWVAETLGGETGPAAAMAG